MISAGLKLKTLPARRASIASSSTLLRAESIDVNAQRLGMADGIGELHFAFFRQACRDHILCNPAPHVSRAAIDFARIFSRKRASAVPAHSAIGIDR